MGRRLLAAGLMVAFGGLTGISCGGGFEGVHSGRWYGEGGERAEAPREVSARMESCARTRLERLAPAEYPVRLVVRVDEEGRVSGAEVERSTVGDAGLEGCLVGAVMGASFAGSVPGLRGGGRVAGGVASPEGRGLVGHPAVLVAPAAETAAEALAAAAGAALSPVVITVGVVTVVIVITVYMVAKVTDSTDAESERERCRKVVEACIKKCTKKRMPTYQPDGMPYHKCMRDCREAEDCWKALY